MGGLSHAAGIYCKHPILPIYPSMDTVRLLEPNALLESFRSGDSSPLGTLSEIQLRVLSKAAKLRLLKMHFEANVGHIGGNLSCLDALLVLYHRVLEERDQFVLAKGHAAGALYIALWTKQLLTDTDLDTFHRDGTLLAGHPIAGWNAHIPFATGSLGHGLSNAVGLALGRKLQHAGGQVYCLASDGEWQEGSNWEALIFAAHHRLANLTLMIDENGMQGFGSTREVASLDPLSEKLRGFAWDVISVDGHDTSEIQFALRRRSEMPRIVMLRTVKGKGVPFMENQMAWHYLPMDRVQYETACQEMEAA